MGRLVSSSPCTGHIIAGRRRTRVRVVSLEWCTEQAWSACRCRLGVASDGDLRRDPCAERESVLPLQLAALAAQDFDGEFEVVVVDNASTDGTAASAAPFEGCLDLSVVRCETLGVNPARNAGAAVARGSRILLCLVRGRRRRQGLGARNDGEARFRVPGRGAAEYRELNHERAIAARASCWRSTACRSTGAHRTQWVGISVCVGGLEESEGFDPTLRMGGDEPDFSFRAPITCGLSGVVRSECSDPLPLALRAAALMMKQFVGYAQGGAQLDAKLERLGFIEPQPLRSKAAAAKGHCRALLRVAPRDVYARELAWTYGCLRGWKAYGRFLA